MAASVDSSYFPQMSNGIGEITCITPVERVLRRLDYICPCTFSHAHQVIDILAAQNIVPDSGGGGADRMPGQAGVMRKIVPPPKSKFQAA